MAAETFIDTSGFYATLVKSDRGHSKAARVLKQASRVRQRFVTTDYVLDETATLLMARGHRHLIAPWFGATLGSAVCRVEWTAADRFGKVVAMFTARADKDWSFTDCLSFVVMKELGLKRALTTDEHFEQAGFVRLLGS